MSDASPTPDGRLDCSEGCDGDHKHKWEIEPHYDSDYDVLVLDCDTHAWTELMKVVELAFDDIEPGQEKVIKIRCNKVTR